MWCAFVCIAVVWAAAEQPSLDWYGTVLPSDCPFCCVECIAAFRSVAVVLVRDSMYLVDGKEQLALDFVYQVANYFSHTMLICAILVIARGRVVSDPTFTVHYKLFMISAVFAYSACFVVMFVYVHFLKEPWDLAWEYNSYIGYIVVILRIGAMASFHLFLRQSYVEEYDDARRAFYWKFGTYFTIWFLLLPAAVIMSVYVDDTIRAKCMVGVDTFIASAGYAGIVYWCWPSRALGQFVTVVPPVDYL